MIKNEIELASKILHSDPSEDARALAAHYIPLLFALEDALRALEYFVECTLATIDKLITLSTVPLYETARQISIAQKALWQLHAIAVDYKFEYRELRVKEVINDFKSDLKKWTLDQHERYADKPNTERLKKYIYK